MSKDKTKKDCKNKTKRKFKKVCKSNFKNQGGGAVYGMGMIGAIVYYIVTATGFWMGVWGVVKAIFWPAFLIYELLEYLVM